LTEQDGRHAIAPPTADDAGEDLLTLPQIAEAIGVSPRTAQRRVQGLGIEPETRLRGVDRYPRETLDRLREVTTTPPVSPDQALAPAVAGLVDGLREAHAAALVSRDDLIVELRRRAEAAEAEVSHLRGERERERAETLALPAPSVHPWWRFWD